MRAGHNFITANNNNLIDAKTCTSGSTANIYGKHNQKVDIYSLFLWLTFNLGGRTSVRTDQRSLNNFLSIAVKHEQKYLPFGLLL